MPRDDFLDGLLGAPLLTKGEEQCLAVAIRDGRNAAAELAAGSTDPLLASLVDEGRRAHRTFIESNLRLVASVATPGRRCKCQGPLPGGRRGAAPGR